MVKASRFIPCSYGVAIQSMAYVLDSQDDFGDGLVALINQLLGASQLAELLGEEIAETLLFRTAEKLVRILTECPPGDQRQEVANLFDSLLKEARAYNRDGEQ